MHELSFSVYCVIKLNVCVCVSMILTFFINQGFQVSRSKVISAKEQDF